jgi:hypothetical protein
LAADTAICTPDTSAPASSPASVCVPKRMPQTMGESITSAPGAIISRRLEAVQMAMQRS